MSAPPFSQRAIAPAARREGVVLRFLRSRLLDALRGLRFGSVRLADGPLTETCGEESGAGVPSATVTVGDPRFYPAVGLGGSLGAAEAYIRGYWSADDLTALLRVFARNIALSDQMDRGGARLLRAVATLAHRLHENTRRTSASNIRAHYDLGNDFFSLFLDPTMTYSCGIFERPGASLEEASIAKLDRVCRKLALGPRDHVVEIGTGWGSFAIHAASIYGCRVTTTTISREQHALASARVSAAGLSDRVTVLLRDYRELDGRFDKLVSIEMIEAVGHRFLDTYFRRCSELVKGDGLVCLQAIVMSDHRYERYRRSVDFIRKYVFPGGHLPSIGAMAASFARATDLRLVHLEDLTPHYVTTLRAWRERFLARLDEVRRLGYSEEFIRLWHYYLCYCEAGFAERYIGDVQLLLAKPGSRERPVLPPLPAVVAGQPA